MGWVFLSQLWSRRRPQITTVVYKTTETSCAQCYLAKCEQVSKRGLTGTFINVHLFLASTTGREIYVLLRKKSQTWFAYIPRLSICEGLYFISWLSFWTTYNSLHTRGGFLKPNLCTIPTNAMTESACDHVIYQADLLWTANK